MDGECILHRTLYGLIRTRSFGTEELLQFVLNQCKLENASEIVLKEIKKSISTFFCQFKSNWRCCQRKSSRFEEKHLLWLEGKLHLPNSLNRPMDTTMRGRPSKTFLQSSKRSKLRKIKPLLATTSHEEILHAASVSLNISGKRDAAVVLNEILQSSPTKATKLKKSLHVPQNKPIPYSQEKALALYVSAKMTKSTYNTIRQMAMLQNCNIYPSYCEILKAKEKCYPNLDSIYVTEISAEVKLQALIDHTNKRVALYQKEVLKQCVSEDDELRIIYKWGCDGSSNQKEYKQAFSLEFDRCSDSDLFMICLVPLQLYAENRQGNKKFIWQNPVPSSTRFCRPIKFVMKKETVELTKLEVSRINEQIASLVPTDLNMDSVNNKNVTSILLFTMVDGKICSSLSDISGQRCLICKASPKEMNSLNLNKEIDESKLSFGLSELHAWIRFFECAIHIAYRLDIKKWQARTKEEKEIVARRKQQIANQFRQETGLLIDQPKQGTGNTKDGNTSRRFFSDPTLSARITGVNESLLCRFATILTAMASGLAIDTNKFHAYAEETRKLYIQLYPWYYMPASVHKVLAHGAIVIKHALMPIGQLSEEAQESRNKDVRRFREHFTRKCSRNSTNEDLFHMLLITSDPLISQQLPIFKHKKYLPLNAHVRNLLKEPSFSDNNNEPPELTVSDDED